MDKGPANAPVLEEDVEMYSGSESGGRKKEMRPTKQSKTYAAAAAGRKHNGNGPNYGKFIQLIEKKEYLAAWHLTMEVSNKRIQQIVEQTTTEIIKKTAKKASNAATAADRYSVTIPSKHTTEIIVRPKEQEQREPPEIVKSVLGIITAIKRKEDVILRCLSTENRDRLIKDIR